MKKIILMLSLLVMAMFLIGCVETSEETGEEVDDDSALTGEALRIPKKSVPIVPKVSTEPDYELVYNNLALEKNKKYRIYYVSGESFKNMPSFVDSESYKTYSQNTAPEIYPGGKYSFDVIFSVEYNYGQNPNWAGWSGCTLMIEGETFELEMDKHYELNVKGKKILTNVYGSQSGTCYLNYFAPGLN
jgi:hypothetical protein